jgi:hypothetical protein
LDGLTSHQVKSAGLEESVSELSEFVIDVVNLGDEDGKSHDSNVVELLDDCPYPRGCMVPPVSRCTETQARKFFILSRPALGTTVGVEDIM